jgi:pimeloyl-ACP methyl ester carboxylesterase
MKSHAILLLATLPLLAIRGAENTNRKQGVTVPESATLALQTVTDGQGSPVVMLSGGTGGVGAFAPHAAVLAKNFRVLRPEWIRIERTRSKQPLPSEYSIKTESAALARSFDQLGISEQVALVGHSFGALVALDFTLDRPDRVRALVLAEPPAFWVVPSKELRTDVQMQAMAELLTRTFGPYDEPTDEQFVRFQSLLGRVGVTPPGRGQPGWEEWVSRRSALRGLSAVSNHSDDPNRLKALRTPVLIVTGKDTVAFHRRINDILAASLPVVKRVELPGGHAAPTTASNEFIATLREFLAHHK